MARVGLDAAWRTIADGRSADVWSVEALPLQFRAALDRLVGGRGAESGAPGRDVVQTGDRLGFWQVERAIIDDDSAHLQLRADVKAPGTVLLTVEATSQGPQRTRVTTTVRLRPSSLWGVAYLLVDLGAREAVVELTHRRLIADIHRPT